MGLAENIPVAPLQFDSAEAFLAWAWAQPERCELFDGIVRMMAGGSANHSRLSRNALSALGHGCAPVLARRSGLTLPSSSIPGTCFFPTKRRLRTGDGTASTTQS